MARFALIVLVAGAVVFALVVVGLGTFPPRATQQQISHTLPLDKVQGN
jgi:hypothetical protein